MPFREDENGADSRIQIGTGNPSIAAELAEVQRYLKSSGLKHTMHSTGTMLGAKSTQNERSRQDANGNLPWSLFSEHLCEAPAGMRRTPSGMFMPYEEEGVSSTDGILDRVIDTVNTARDIAHVIWSVSWRR
ncbi:MTH1187/YkoF-like protein [Fusarium oxysporum f. sp. vasinfectum]|nr:MTH1187/YkoF-like protein [Fusarium oxysporum f. sp. vasinfectum]KAK2922751.1 MTH1187/YkoF-like protein [Fusarium oxysporum f. sp. vasinfectum]